MFFDFWGVILAVSLFSCKFRESIFPGAITSLIKGRLRDASWQAPRSVGKRKGLQSFFPLFSP